MASIAYDKSFFLGGQHAPEWSGHDTPEYHGQLRPELGGQYHRFFHFKDLTTYLIRPTFYSIDNKRRT